MKPTFTLTLILALILLLPACSKSSGPQEREHSPNEETAPDNVQTDPSQPENPFDETEGEVAEALSDPSTRFVKGDYTLRLDTPGNIFDISTDNRTITVRSLSTGSQVVFVSPTSLFPSYPKPLEGCTLSINGRDVPLKTVTAHSEGPTLWLHISPQQSAPAWLVVDSLQ